MSAKGYIKAVIKSKIEGYYHELYPNIEVNVKDISHFFANSEMFRCIIKVKNEKKGEVLRYIFAKRAKDLSSNNEYKNIKYLWNMYYSNESIYRIPKPFDYIEEIDTMLCEEVRGENLLRLLMKVRFLHHKNMMKEIEMWIREVAKWLVLFQKVTNPYKKKNMEEYIFQAKEQLHEIPFIIDKYKIINILEKRASRLPEIPITLCHGDFSMRNIMITDPGITVVDWGWIRYDHPFFDVHTFLFNLKRYLKFIYRPVFIKNLQEAFLDEYLKKTQFKFKVSDEVFNVTKILFLINCLTEVKSKKFLFKEQFKRDIRKEFSNTLYNLR